MTRPRALMAGMTDYTGVQLPDIIDHIVGWRDDLDFAVSTLIGMRERLGALGNDWRVTDGVGEASFFIDLFERYRADVERLRIELPNGVHAKHVEIVEQIYRSAVLEEKRCVSMKMNHHLYALSESNQAQTLVGDIYAVSRDTIVNLKDFSNLAPRLRTFVGSSPAVSEAEPTKALELKPNVFGVGLNLNHIVDRLIARWRRSRGAG